MCIRDRGVAAHQAVREGVCGIDGREARDAEQRRFSADLNAVLRLRLLSHKGGLYRQLDSHLHFHNALTFLSGKLL